MKLSARLAPKRLAIYAAVLALLWITDPLPITYAAGCVLALAGIWLRVWGCGHLRKNEDVTTSGPYGYVKNPLYLGTFLIFTGLLIAAGSPRMPALLAWIVALPLFLAGFFGYYLPRKFRIEGSRLRERFGDRFADFERSVPDFWPSFARYQGASNQPWSREAFIENNEFGLDLIVIALFAAMPFLGQILPGR